MLLRYHQLGQRFPSSSPGADFAPRTGFEDPNVASRSLERLQGGRIRLSITTKHADANAVIGFRGQGLVGEGGTWSLGQVRVFAMEPLGDGRARAITSAWAKLGDANNLSAMRAMGELVRGGNATVGLLRNKLLPTASNEKIEKLITDLDAKDFREREAATRALIACGPVVRGRVHQVMEDADSPELRGRLRLVLRKFSAGELSEEKRIRCARAVEVMRWMEQSVPTRMLQGIALTSPYRQMRAYARGALVARVLPEVEELSGRARAKLLAAQWAPARRLYTRALERCKGDVFEDTALVDRRAELAHILRSLGLVETMVARVKSNPKDARNTARLANLLGYSLNAPSLLWTVHPNPPKDDGTSALSRRAQMDRAESLLKLSPRELLEIANVCVHAPDLPDDRIEQRFLLRRGRRCARRALQMLRAKQEDLRAAGAKLLREAQGRLALLSASRQGWVNLVTPLSRSLNGKWRWRPGTALVRASQFGTLALYTPVTGPYALDVRFRRSQGNDGVFIGVPVLPAGKTRGHRGNLNLGGWGGACSGLEVTSGRAANQNSTTFKPGGIVTGREHHVEVLTVPGEAGSSQMATISMWLDGVRRIRWRGAANSLSTSSVWKTPSLDRLFVVGAHMSSVEFQRVSVFPLGGLVPAPMPTRSSEGPRRWSAVPPE